MRKLAAHCWRFGGENEKLLRFLHIFTQQQQQQHSHMWWCNTNKPRLANRDLKSKNLSFLYYMLGENLAMAFEFKIKVV